MSIIEKSADIDYADRRARLAAAIVGILDAWHAGVCEPTRSELIALAELCRRYNLPHAAHALDDLIPEGTRDKQTIEVNQND